MPSNASVQSVEAVTPASEQSLMSQIELNPPPVPVPARVQHDALRRVLSPAHIALAAILALSAVLNTYKLSQNAWANTFYSAGVKSMLASLHNFFFVSFDRGGLVTIDKPPLGVWVQVASAKLFGFTPLSLLLPEAIIGTMTVALLYVILARRLGELAALTAALALAVFPIFVAVSRDNGVDPLLILLMLLACVCALRAVERDRVRWLLASALLVGLAFNTKTLAAYLVVPGIALGWLVCTRLPWPRRLLALAGAGIVVVVASFAWIAAVELTPASQRPYVGSSTNNTELGLTFEYNGFGRVEGEVGGPGKIPVRSGGLVPTSTHPRGSSRARQRAPSKKPAIVHSKYLPDGRYRYPIAFGGKVGPLRLFDSELDGQSAWLLPLAIFGLIALALQVVAGRRDRGEAGAGHYASASVTGTRELAATSGWRRDPRLAVLLVLGGWFVVELIVLSWSKGIVHPYYISALAPGAAAMIGAGVGAFAAFARSAEELRPVRGARRDPRSADDPRPVRGALQEPRSADDPRPVGGARRDPRSADDPRPVGGKRREPRMASDPRLLLLVAAVVATVFVQVRVIEEQSYLQWFVPFLIVAAGLTLAASLVRRFAPVSVTLLLLALLVAPTAYAATTWLAPVEGTFPAAGPHEAIGLGAYDLEPRPMRETLALVAYAARHRGGWDRRGWSLLTDSSPTAAPMILLGSPAGALGGYGGSDPVLDGRGLARLVARGEARYVVIGGEYAERGGNKATAAVIHDCPQVPHERWHGPPPGPAVLVLFDCAGRERPLEAHPAG